MARLCVRIAPNNHPTDPSLDALRTHPGDVVCIVDDDHKFSEGELNCGQYRIIDLPGVPQEDLTHLCAHVEDVEGKTIRRRAVALDMTALKSAAWKNVTKISKDQIAAITIAKA